MKRYSLKDSIDLLDTVVQVIRTPRNWKKSRAFKPPKGKKMHVVFIDVYEPDGSIRSAFARFLLPFRVQNLHALVDRIEARMNAVVATLEAGGGSRYVPRKP